MHGDEHPTLVQLRNARERVLEALSKSFRRDEIGLDEFEARVDRAFAARSSDELAALVCDLSSDNALARSPPVDALVTSGASAHGLVPAKTALAVRNAPKARGTVALFSSIERSGRLSIENGSRVVAIFGNVELDLRAVDFPEGVTELFVRAVFGNVEITVPPTLAIESQGGGFFGSFSAKSRVPPGGVTSGPILRIIGSAVLGNVEIHTRPRGEPESAQPKLLGPGR